MIYCHHCGKAVPTGTKFCPYCGHLVNGTQRSVSRSSHSIRSHVAYPFRRHKRRGAMVLLLIIGIIVILIASDFGLRAYHQREYYATNYINLNYDGGKYGYDSNVSQAKFWQKAHYVIVKKNVRAYDISAKGTAIADNYSIGSKILKKGAIVKTRYLPTIPGGFAIYGKGFHHSDTKESVWVVNPYSIDSKTAPTAKKCSSNYWIKAVRKY